uniref:Uncharacterized protein n=1 Tax=Glossina morsitans morsitans TaxID=37546 RepID=A0A1B0FHH3_GLOMM
MLPTMHTQPESEPYGALTLHVKNLSASILIDASSYGNMQTWLRTNYALGKKCRIVTNYE